MLAVQEKKKPIVFEELDLDFIEKQARIEELKQKVALQKAQAAGVIAIKAVASGPMAFGLSVEECMKAGKPEFGDVACDACNATGQYGWCAMVSPGFQCPRK